MCQCVSVCACVFVGVRVYQCVRKCRTVYVYGCESVGVCERVSVSVCPCLCLLVYVVQCVCMIWECFGVHVKM